MKSNGEGEKNSALFVAMSNNTKMEQQNGLIACQREMFDIPDEVAYLNCAYSSPMLKTVASTGVERLGLCGQPWRISTTDFFEHAEQARIQFAGLIEAEADDIAIINSVSYGIAIAAQNLPLQAGQRIVVLQDQFPSNIYAWQELARQRDAQICTVAESPADDLTTAVLDRITESTGIVALPQVRWTDGALLDLELIGRRCRELGAALVLDLTQSLGAMPFSVQNVQADFVVCAAYKWLLGPYGVSFLYARSDRQQGEPIENPWIARQGSDDFARLTQYQSQFRQGARRYDAGEPYHLTLSMAVEALRQVHRWGSAAISATIATKTRQLAEQSESLGFQPLPEAKRAPHILGINIGDRDGAHLAQTLANDNVHVSLRGQFLRISPHVYNTEQDLERLVATLAACEKTAGGIV